MNQVISAAFRIRNCKVTSVEHWMSSRGVGYLTIRTDKTKQHNIMIRRVTWMRLKEIWFDSTPLYYNTNCDPRTVIMKRLKECLVDVRFEIYNIDDARYWSGYVTGVNYVDAEWDRIKQISAA